MGAGTIEEGTFEFVLVVVTDEVVVGIAAAKLLSTSTFSDD